MKIKKGSIAVITGGTGVLCGAMALHLVSLGCKVGIMSRSSDKVDQLVNAINQSGGSAVNLAADVLDQKSVENARKKLNDTFGSCDILINGAGGNHPKGTTSKTKFESGDEENSELNSFFSLDPEAFKYVFDLNFQGTFLPTQIFAKDMLGKEGCSIINISSMSAFSPMTKVGAYSAAKAAISNFTEWLAVHFAEEGIRVNAIAPGFFLTDQNRELLTTGDGSLTTRGNTIISQTPMRRFGKSEDLLSTLEWLCSIDSAFVTGIVVPVDGGFNAFSGV